MRTPFVFVAGLLALLLAAGPASAQGFGLDLSDETTSTPEEDSDAAESDISNTEMPDTGSLGLDLSGGMPAAVDLQPRFVLLGLEAPRRTPAKAVKRWQGWLEGVARRTGRVAVNRTVQDAEQTLGSDHASALRCAEASCFAEPADMLEADLVTTASLSRQGRSWTLRMWTYDRDRGVVEEAVVTGRSPRDSRFIREAGTTLGRRLTELARPRSLLKVSVNAPQAVVRAGERMLGLGNVEARLAPGEVALTVEAEDYQTFTRTVTLAPG
ncbi:MAG TPA: hypothetical protein VLQ93_13595, partial [Myxococcaceae bacterium]|nr:hypothetical protein [Myxococcaceae bacterium]